MDDRPTPPRARVNIRIRQDLKDLAKAEGLSISRVAEEALEGALIKARTRQFREENRAALDAANRYADRHGLWSDKYRLF